MNNAELNCQVYSKACQEEAAYIDWLTSLPPNEILQHSYEYTVRQDIIFAMEYETYTDEQCKALLKSPCIVKDILQDFYKLETGYMDTIRDCITGRADKMIQLEKHREEAR